MSWRIDDLGPALGNLEERDRAEPLDVVSRQRRRTGVHAEHAAHFFDPLDVGVAEDHDVEVRATAVALHRSLERPVADVRHGHRVRDADARAGQLEVPALAQAWVLGLHGPPAGAVVAVAARDEDRRDLAELVDHREVVDIAGVEDAVDAVERLEDLRIELGHRLGDVRIGDEPNPQRGRVRRAARSDRGRPPLVALRGVDDVLERLAAQVALEVRAEDLGGAAAVVLDAAGDVRGQDDVV